MHHLLTGRNVKEKARLTLYDALVTRVINFRFKYAS